MVAMAVATAAFLPGSSADAQATGNPPPAPDTASSTSASAVQQLAERYSPILYLKQQSSICSSDGDPYDPVSVDTVLGNPAIDLREAVPGNPVIAAGPTAADLFGLDKSYYLDYPGNPRSRGCGYKQDAARFSEGEPRVTYVHLAREANHPGFVLQYWFFYYFNGWNNRHEGDWEMVQVAFQQDTPQEALGHYPVGLAYAQHSGGETAKWTSGKVHKEGGHPVVYVGSGSHASFYTRGLYLGRGENGTGLGCDDATGPSRRVAPEVRLLPESVTQADDSFAWISFEGAWGELAGGEFDGPNGPNTTYQWYLPFHWAEEQRHSSVTVPGGSLLGGNASAFFCRGVSEAARGLEFAHDWPLVAGGSASIVLVAALGLVAVGFRDARHTELPSLRASGYLRRKRRFGQVLRLAVHLYRQHAIGLLALTAIYVPLGLVAVGLQDLLAHVPPFSNILDFFDARPAGTLLGLIYGSIESLVALIFVVTAITAGLADIDAGRRLSPKRALRTLWHRAGRLAYARFRALAIVALLGISIVGIPLAIRQTVRWYFIEQSIIFDDARRDDAAARSAAAVDGEWWRSFFITLAVGALVTLTGPVIATALILGTRLPLELVNIVNAAVYALLIPFVAIVLALAYLDLEERRLERTVRK